MPCLQRVWLLILIQCRLVPEGRYNPLLLKDSWFEIAHNVGWGLHVNMQTEREGSRCGGWIAIGTQSVITIGDHFVHYKDQL